MQAPFSKKPQDFGAAQLSTAHHSAAFVCGVNLKSVLRQIQSDNVSGVHGPNPCADGAWPNVLLVRDKQGGPFHTIKPGADQREAREIEAEAEREQTTFAVLAALYLDRLEKTGRSQPTLMKARGIVDDLALNLRPTQVSDITPRAMFCASTPTHSVPRKTPMTSAD